MKSGLSILKKHQNLHLKTNDIKFLAESTGLVCLFISFYDVTAAIFSGNFSEKFNGATFSSNFCTETHAPNFMKCSPYLLLRVILSILEKGFQKNQ